jgi:hypothetical protein
MAHCGLRPNKIISAVFIKNGNLTTEETMKHSIRGVFVNPLTIYDWKANFAEVQRKKRSVKVIPLLKETEPNISDLRFNEV